MSVHRCFVPPNHIQGSTITIDHPQDVHHIRTVLRLNIGDPLICFDGQGSECVGTIMEQSSRRLLVRIERQTRPTRASDTPRLWLGQSLLKSDRFDWVVQKATELGVERLSPLITDRTVVRLTAEQGRAKCARWQRIAQEAAKQCGRTTVPIMDPPQGLAAALQAMAAVPLILIPTLEVATTPLHEVLTSSVPRQELALLIGPEGDFTQAEVARAQAHGARPVSLGDLTLRSETAAVAILAIVRYALHQP